MISSQVCGDQINTQDVLRIIEIKQVPKLEMWEPELSRMKVMNGRGHGNARDTKVGLDEFPGDLTNDTRPISD